MSFIAALPMYDWAEVRSETDALWAGIRDALRAEGLEASEQLTRRNGDLPALPGGLLDRAGKVIAPDPALLPPDELDFHALWLHPDLLLAQTCWGPMELGLREHVQVVGQPDYSAFEGGQGQLYSSAIVMRRGEGEAPAPADGGALIPLDLLAGKRFAFNSSDSMSGIIALGRDLEATGEGLEIFAERIQTGAHCASARAVAEGGADVAALDCRSWDMIRRFQPEVAGRLEVVGWTARRKGLPYITSRRLPEPVVEKLRGALRLAGVLAA